MKKLLTRILLALALVVVGLPAALIAAASLPWYRPPPAAPPRVEAVAHGRGPLLAGVGEAAIEVPPGAPIAGFARLAWQAAGVRNPVGARALVLSAGGCRIALASAEILLAPEELVDAVRARIADVPLDALVVAATHTHAGPGGYWEDPVGERLGTGPYDPRARDAVANAIAGAIRKAAAAAGPARLSVARGRAAALARNRGDGQVDARLAVLRVEGPGGAPVAELVAFPAHATTLGGENRAISGDWVGRFLADGGRGTRLFFQGAVGDQSVALPGVAGRPSPEAYGDAVSAAVAALPSGPADPAPTLAAARVEVALPAPDPGAVPPLLRRAAATLAHDALPSRARVTALRLGPLVLVAVPAEPVAEVAARWRTAAADPDLEIVSLADGYAGYVETPESLAARRGETDRTYYGPTLADRLGKAVQAAVAAVRAPAAAR